MRSMRSFCFRWVNFNCFDVNEYEMIVLCKEEKNESSWWCSDMYGEWWRWWLRRQRWWWGMNEKYTAAHDRDSNFCVCDLNQRCGTTDCIVESFECPLHIVWDVQMLCMFLRSLWIGAIACARKHTQTHTFIHLCTYTHINMDRQREERPTL